MVGVYIVCAFLMGVLARQAGMPPLVGFLVAGFGLNAAGFGDAPGLEAIAHIGVLIMLFTVGLKIRLRNILRVEVWGSALIHLALSTFLVAVLLKAVLDLDWTTALIVGGALGFSSTVIAAKSLDEKRELRAFHGRVAIGILIVQDLAAIALLSFTKGVAPSPLAIALVALVFARPVLYRMLALSGHGELVVLLGLGLAVAGGFGFEALGLSGELGALILGSLLADHTRANELFNGLWSLKEAFLVGFFLMIGMSGLPDESVLGFTVLMLALLPLKGLLFFVLLVAFRLRARSGFLAGLSLATYSEFGLIVTQGAAGNGLIDEKWVVALAVVVAASFAVTAPVNRFAHTLYDRMSHVISRFQRGQRHPDDEPISLGSAEIAVFGMGRVGTGAYEFLKSRGKRVVGLDSDPGKVQRHLAEGRRVVYADAENPDLWVRLNLDGVDALLLALPDLETKRLAITQIRRAGYTGLVSATNLFPEEAKEILDCGCSTTYNYYEQAGVGFAGRVWETLHPEASETTG